MAHNTLSISLMFCNLRGPMYNLLCFVAVVSLIKLFLQAEGRAETVCRGRKVVMLMVEQRLGGGGQDVFGGVVMVPCHDGSGEDAQRLSSQVQHRAL